MTEETISHWGEPNSFGVGWVCPYGCRLSEPCPQCFFEKATDIGKPTNPKDAVASDKLPLHLVPASFKAYAAVALMEGALKYGANNWRESGVRSSVYVSALFRHVDKWFNGEDVDPETGVPHLANASACLAILIDSLEHGNMTDDRPPAQAGLPDLVNKRAPAMIAGLREIFGHLTPKHWTREL